MTKVTTTYLQMTSSAQHRPARRALPEAARIELVQNPTPEYSKFLYRSVGSELHWADRLENSREEWNQVLQRPGSETWVLYWQGAPQGYIELVTEATATGSDVEIYYFGLFPQATGQGFGSILLSHGIASAWTIAERHPVPPVQRVWLHTCSLDSPAALPNYQARGFEIYRTEEAEEQIKDASLGLWPERP